MATPQQIEDALAGRYGVIAPASWRAHNVDRRGNFIADLTDALVRSEDGGLVGGSLSCDNRRDTIMECSLQLLVDRIPGGIDAIDHIALYEDRVIRPAAPRHVVYDGDTRGYTAPSEPETVEFPAGVYLPSFTSIEDDESGRQVLSLRGHDLSAHLLRSKTQGAYSIAQGTAYIAAVRDLLDLEGLRHDLPPATLTLAQAHNRGADTPLAEIARDLTDGLVLYPVYPSLRGIFTTRPRLNPALEDAAVHYRDDVRPLMFDASAPYVRNLNVAQVDNQVVVVVDDPRREDITPKYVQWRNSDPTSPVSTVTGGYKSTLELKSDTRPSTRCIYSLAAATEMAQYELRRAAVEARTRRLVTFGDPRRGPRETYRVTVQGSEEDVLVRVLSWSRDLRPGAAMEHEVALASHVALTEGFEA